MVEDLQKLDAMFQDSFVDPFKVSEAPSNLVHVGSGVIASHDVQCSMMGALEKGKTSAEKFVSERLVETTSSKSFYDPVLRCNIKTMGTMNKSVRIRSKDVCLDADTMYLRLLGLNARKQLSLRRLMPFENSPVPPSLFS